MKKVIAILVVLGITFIFNVKTKKGFVYKNNSPNHGIILIDPDLNTYVVYGTVELGRETMTKGLSEWMKDKDERLFQTISSFIVPVSEMSGFGFK